MGATEAARGREYLPQLDSLRAIAVITVMFHHFARRSHFAAYFPTGLFGVRLFFALSGFLITGILLSERRKLTAGVSLRRIARVFYLRRALRLLPLFYGVLVIVALTRGLPNDWRWHVFYASNLCIAYHGNWCSFGPYWSLAVEEQFYMLWPWAVLLAPTRWLRNMTLALILLGPLSRYVVMLLTGNTLSAEVTLVGCLDSLGAGACLAIVAGNERASAFLRGKISTSLSILALVCGVLLHNYLRGRGVVYVVAIDVLLAIFFCWLVIRSASGFDGIPGRVMKWRPLQFVGRISYGIYILHQFVPPLAQRLHVASALETNWITEFLAYSIISILAAAVSWRFFEGPINRAKQKLRYSPEPRVAVQSA